MQGFQRKAYEFFEDNTRSIELIFDDELEQVYFIKQPVTRLLSEASKQEFYDTVDRSSLLKKHLDLLSHSQKLFSRMEYSSFMQRSGNSFVEMCRVVYTHIDNVILTFSFLSNLCVLFLDNYGSESFGIKEDNLLFVL